VSELTFSQPERRSFVLPILIAVVVLAVGFFIAQRYFFTPGTITLEQVHTAILPTVTTYKADSMVVAANETDSNLFVASTVRLTNGLRFPVTIDKVSLILTDKSGAQLTETALSKRDLAISEQSFAKLTPLAGTPLLPETEIGARQSAEGTVVFSFPLADAVWNTRDSAVVQVELYHQPPITVVIPH
jgi:hypothetical protein